MVALLLVGSAKRRAWGAAAATAAGLALLFAVSMPGAFAFMTFQRDRGTEVESLGSLVFHIARHHGWEGQVLLNYGSVEFLGPYVDLVSTAALLLTALAFGWLLMWRLLATRFLAHTVADAAFVAVLLFTTTSRVISPQYMVWLVGLAAACLVFRGSRMGLLGRDGPDGVLLHRPRVPHLFRERRRQRRPRHHTAGDPQRPAGRRVRHRRMPSCGATRCRTRPRPSCPARLPALRRR